MGSNALAFAAGLGSGYLSAKQRAKDDERQAKQDAWTQEQQDQTRKGWARDEELRTGLSNAAKPAVMETSPGTDMAPGEMGPSPVAPSLASYKVGDQQFLDQGQAQKGLADYNSPTGIATRQAKVYAGAGMADKAMSMENAALSRTREDQRHNQEQQDRARKFKEEGVFNAVRAFRQGDAKGLVEAFNAGGEYKLDGEPVVTKEMRQIPGVGEVPTYSAKLRIVGPDGQVKEQAYNSHDLSMNLMPYEKSLEFQRKGTDSDNKAAHQKEMVDLLIKRLELTGQLVEAKALKAAANGGAIGREERLRYTDLFTDAGRRLGEAQRALATLQSKASFMMNAQDPRSPEALQLQDLRSSIKTYGEERSLYQGLLSGSQSADSKPGLADGKAPVAKQKTPASGDFSYIWK